MTTAIEKIIESQGLLLLEVDCTVAMPNLPAECVDSIVTDPPYGLEFMGKEWDKLSGQDWHLKWATAAFRLLKPGGHMLVFGGTRTYHRLACAVEDAGFELRDSIHWLYGSGFPKSLDVSKAIDKAAGAERVVIRARTYEQTDGGGYSGDLNTSKPRSDSAEITAPATDAAKQWDGWGTALKPAHEPILLARKPLGEKTVAANVLKHGTGGLNIDGGRIVGQMDGVWGARQLSSIGYHGTEITEYRTQKPEGRWPANLILQHSDDCSDDQCVPGCPVAELDGQSGNRPGGHFPAMRTENAIYGGGKGTSLKVKGDEHVLTDSGGASRFFYQAKSSSSERNKGCDDLYWARTKSGHTPITQAEYEALDPKQRAQGNIHPTVKPIDLMRYLIRLVTPPGGTVLDPFLGSGTTALAANLEGFGCLAMESDPTSVLIARARWSGLH